MTPKAALQSAIDKAGSQYALADIIGCTQANVSKMLRTGNIAAKYVLPIEGATGVSRHDLAPEIYPREDTAA